MKRHDKRVKVLQAFESRSFTLFWLGQTFSAMGNDAYSIALSWEILLLTGSARWTALARIVEEVPRIIFLLLGGVAADRLPQRRIILWSDVGRGLIVFIVLFLAAVQALQIWHLLIAAFLFGMVRGFFAPAYRSFLPQLALSKEHLQSVNALNGFSRQGSELIGPSLGSLLFAINGAVGAFLFDAFTFIFSAFCTLGISITAPALLDEETSLMEHASRRRALFRGIGSDITDGIRYVLSVPWLWLSILIVSIGGSGILGMDQVALPKLLNTHLTHSGVLLFGAIGSLVAGGALVSTFVLGQLRIRHRGVIEYLGLALTGCAFTLFSLPLPMPILPMVFLFLGFSAGFGAGIFIILWDMLLQTRVPQEKLGRVYSIYLLCYYLSNVIGLGISGIVSDQFGPRWIFIGGGLLIVLLSVLALSLPSIRQLVDE